MSITEDALYKRLHIWYQEFKRDLPWRNTSDPYKIWISEVILQQTRVVQGLPYYYKFVELFPTITDLAEADEQTILRCWQGLGYYSRARNMHTTAKIVAKDYDGKFPTSYNELIKLKGIGPYTAAAISSFASNEDVAVLDGNVMRVLTRLYNNSSDIAEEKTRKELQRIATDLLPKGKSAVHNQAMMELGAMICIPKNPKCEFCPVNTYCLALKESTVQLLPVKSKKVKVRTRFFNYVVLKNFQNDYFLKSRDNTDIWAGLWDFHLIISSKSIESPDELALDSELISKLTFVEASAEVKHQLTHQTLFVKFWLFDIQRDIEPWLIQNKLSPLSIKEIHAVPKPILINNFLDKYLFSNFVV